MFKVSEQQFRACNVFKDAKLETIEILKSMASAVAYSKNQEIYEQGDVSTDCHLMVSGLVRAKGLSPEGKEVTYGDIGSGELFGEFAAIDNHPRSSGVVAVEDVQALKLPTGALRQAIETDGKVAIELMLSLIDKTRIQTSRIYEFSVFAVRQRVQLELLRLADSNGAGDGNEVTINVPTHQEMANRLSTHREAVTRELRFLVSENLIKTNRNQVHILNLNRLRQFAGSDPH